MKSGMTARIAANGKTSTGEVEHPAGQSMGLIHSEPAGGKRLENHTLAGNPPFPFEACAQVAGKNRVARKTHILKRDP
jgi:hypothetical protein